MAKQSFFEWNGVSEQQVGNRKEVIFGQQSFFIENDDSKGKQSFLLIENGAIKRHGISRKVSGQKTPDITPWTNPPPRRNFVNDKTFLL